MLRQLSSETLGGCRSSPGLLLRLRAAATPSERVAVGLSCAARQLQHSWPKPPEASSSIPVVAIKNVSGHCQMSQARQTPRFEKPAPHPESITDPGQGQRRRGREPWAPVWDLSCRPKPRTPSQPLPQPSCWDFSRSSEMGPDFAQAATGFSSLAAQSQPALQIGQASRSSRPVQAMSLEAQPGSHWLWGIPWHRLTPRCGVAMWPGPGEHEGWVFL